MPRHARCVNTDWASLLMLLRRRPLVARMLKEFHALPQLAEPWILPKRIEYRLHVQVHQPPAANR